jgi:lipoprotein-anchoring transpeptidase ErfK/SrfK
VDRLKILGSRRGAVVTFGVAGLAVVAAGAFATSQVVGRPAVDAPTPAPGSAVASATPTISFDTAATELTRLSVSVDGTDVSELARSMDGRVVLVAPKLGQGEHTVSVSVESPNLIKGSTSRTWSFAVDTVAPKLKIATPKDDVWVSSRTVKVAGTSEPGATVRVAWEGGSVEGTVGDDGKFSVQPKLADGPAELQITVTDAAGNVTTGQRRVLVDSVPPKLGLSAPGDGAKLEEDDRVVFEGAVPNEPIETLTVGATVNGKKVVEVGGAEAAAITEAIAEGAYYEETPPLQLDGKRFSLLAGSLPQGQNTIVVWVRDRAGNKTTVKRRIMVDTSNEFGAHEMVRGAVGEDVVGLQQRLKEAGVFKGKPSQKYDKRVEGAVRRYQKKFRLPITGRVDNAMLQSMVGRIVVDLSDKRLQLIRNGKAIKTYSVAIGQPAHPTPTGTYTITTLQVDPTWNPPDSPWAEGLGPIPPGPGNPLGTRWIGTSAPAIGIHGTYADSSIGTAASHGCIRMHIPEVEALYEEVAIGMEVEFRQ